jgi:hypothetical protein
MTKRPSVLDLDSLMVRKPAVAPAAPAPEPESIAEEVELAAQPKPAAKVKAPATFRTSVYFDRRVHDKLRDIAHEERKSITDLINEGLDHVLVSRNYPTTEELRRKK